MSYFDHVRCDSCGHRFDPEKVDSSGGTMACPACGAGLQLKSLFGVRDAFSDMDPEDSSLDDAMPKKGVKAYGGGWQDEGQIFALDSDGNSRFARPKGDDPRGGAQAQGGPDLSDLEAQYAKGSSGNLPVHQPSDEDDEFADEEPAASALDALRDLKRR